MSFKRRATTELNHENWNHEDPTDCEEMGAFKPASKDILQTRVIRTAKRRVHLSAGDNVKKNAFSGFGGFNKSQPSSFDFLANLTNGNKTVGSSPTSKIETTTSSSPLSSKPPTNLFNTTSPSSGLFGAPASSEPAMKPVFGMPTTQTYLFGGLSNSSKTSFTVTNPVSLASDSPFKMQVTTTTPETFKSDFTFKTSSANITPTTSQTPTVFGTPSATIPQISPTLKTTNLTPTSSMTSLSLPSTTTSSMPTTFKAINSIPSTSQTTSIVFGSASTNSPMASAFKTSNFAAPTSQITSVFGSPSTTTSPIPSTFKDTNVTSTQKTTLFGSTFASTSQNPSILGSPSKSATTSKPLFSTTTTTVSPVAKSQPGLNTSTPQNTFSVTPKAGLNIREAGSKVNCDNKDKELMYYYKLTALNKSVTLWIKNNIEETPICILSPIFRDYEKYLKEIQDEYYGSNKGNALNKEFSNENATVKSKSSELISKSNEESSNDNTATNSKNTSDTPFKNTAQFAMSNNNTLKTDPPNKTSLFAIQSTNTEVGKPSNYSFGIKTTTDISSTTKASTGLSFGITTTPSMTFPLLSNTTTTTSNGNAPFSFGIGKPFSFSSNIQKSVEKSNETKEEEDGEPPKVEFTPVVEENSVFDKRCKVFFKKDGNFVDKGLGTLYIKKIEDSGKHQLLIRANTNLGNVLINLVLSSSIPTQRMGKNNVMMVCIPTPDAKPPPTPILIRVKTAEEADDLLETLNKYKS